MSKYYLAVNFDELKDLYEKSPDEFELRRQNLVSNFIASLPNKIVRKKIKGLQFKIDMERRKSKNPYDSCIKLNKLLRDFFEDEFKSAVNFRVKNNDIKTAEATSNKVVDLTDFKKIIR